MDGYAENEGNGVVVAPPVNVDGAKARSVPRSVNFGVHSQRVSANCGHRALLAPARSSGGLPDPMYAYATHGERYMESWPACE